MQCGQIPGKQRGTIERQVIGITGGIGSGKSRVSSFLAEKYNLPLLNLDQICRDMLEPGEAAWQALRTFLSNEYFGKDRELDRQYFRKQLFTDSALRNRVDALLHPLARGEMKQRIRALAQKNSIMPASVGASPCVRPCIPDTGRHGDLPLQTEFPILVEIPLLFEAGWQNEVDIIILVYADENIRIQRIIQRDQVSVKQARQAVAAQQCLREKAASADYVIDNSASWKHTCSRIHQLFAAEFFQGFLIKNIDNASEN